MNPFRRLVIPVFILLGVIVLAVLGYMSLEGFSFLDALYMVVITLSTVGFREVHDLNATGRLLTIGVIVVGVGTVAYTVGQLIEILVEGQVVGYRRKKNMEKKIMDLRDHYIICGFGRVGHEVAKSFQAQKIPFVVIDSKNETAEELIGMGAPFIIGDASSDDTLESAGVRSAKGLVAASDSDVTNVFVTLSSRVLNPKLFIVARASFLESEKKLKKAGANRVISPYFIAGQRLATMALRPATIDFIDTVLRGEESEHNIEEVKVMEGSMLVSRSIGESEIKSKTGATILAVKKSSGSFELHPSATTTLEVGDILLVLGTSSELHGLEALAVKA